MTDYTFDAGYAKQYGVVCGTDEAGRGPLAGSVVAAAVVLPDGIVIEGLDDSKKLTEKKREKLFDVIINSAAAYGIAEATETEIDETNILAASLLAMRRAADQVKENSRKKAWRSAWCSSTATGRPISVFLPSQSYTETRFHSPLRRRPCLRK